MEMLNAAEATLRKYLQLSEELQTHTDQAARLKTIFSNKQLNALKKYLREIDLKFFGMTKVQCKRLVYEYAESIGVDHPFNKDTRMASDEWLNTFMKEFKFTVRPHDSAQSSRGTACDQNHIDTFFKVLSYLRKNFNFLPEKIYHADEICISAVPNDLTRYTFLSQNRSKGPGRLLVETRENVTLVCCANAAGSYIPPMIVFPRDKMIPGFLRGLPPGSIGYTSEKGLINSELFLTFLKHFIQHALPSSQTPVLMLIDNYISYISLEALEFCRDNNVIVMGFPPNSRQKLQPLDLSFFGPLKACYSQACDGFSDAYPRVKLTVDNVGEVFRTAYCRTATPANAVRGFEESGIHPFRPQLFCSAAVLADQMMAESTSEDSDVEIVSWQDPTQEQETLGGTEAEDGHSISCLRCTKLSHSTDWAQCSSCRQWWHKNCEGFCNGVQCDHCKEFAVSARSGQVHVQILHLPSLG